MAITPARALAAPAPAPTLVPPGRDAGKPGFGTLLGRRLSPGALARLLDLETTVVPQAALAATLLAPVAEVLRRPGRRFRARLVAHGWAVGGSARPLPDDLTDIVELIHAGSLVVDDVQDGSAWRRGAPALHRTRGVPLAINTGNWLYFWPLHLLSELGLAPRIELRLRRRITRTMFRCHFGQALDLGTDVTRLAQAEVPGLVRAATELKTGSLTELAAWLGAAAGDASPASRRAIARFGRHLGIGLQMLDDLGNLRPTARAPEKRHEDLRLGRPTWVWAWLAATREPSAFRSLQRRARRIRDGHAPAGPLGETLHDLVGHRGRAEADRLLDRALAALTAAVGPTSALRSLQADVDRLRVSFG